MISCNDDGPAVDLLVFYPEESLSDQVAAWRARHSQCSVAVSHAKSVSRIRRALRDAEAVLFDATEDPVQTMKAFSQSVVRLRSCAAAVYTERMTEALELFVRRHGALVLLGPLTNMQWEQLFERMLPAHAGIARPVAMRTTTLPLPLVPSSR